MRASTARAVYACGSLAKEGLKALLLKMAVVREDLNDIVLSRGVYGNTVSEAVLLIRALFIQHEALKE
jgi:hypothetical protein